MISGDKLRVFRSPIPAAWIALFATLTAVALLVARFPPAVALAQDCTTALDPGFSIVLPDDEYQTRHLTDFVEIAGSNVSLMVHKNPQPFVDPCSTAEERADQRCQVALTLVGTTRCLVHDPAGNELPEQRNPRRDGHLERLFRIVGHQRLETVAGRGQHQ